MSDKDTQAVENSAEDNPIVDLINHSLNQDYNKANEIFGDVLGQKLDAALEQEKIRMANSVYNGNDPDEEENDDESDEQLELDLEDEDEFGIPIINRDDEEDEGEIDEPDIGEGEIEGDDDGAEPYEDEDEVEGAAV